MINSYKIVIVRSTILMLVFMLCGCDRLSSFFDYFKSGDQTATAQSQTSAPRPATTTSSSNPQTQKTSKPLTKDTLAQVGDWTITKDEFQERLQALKEVAPDFDINDVEQNKLVLDELIRQQLLIQEAKRQGLPQKDEIRQAVEEFQNTLLVREMANRLIGDIQVTDEEAEQYYEQNKQDFVEPEQWRLREIIIPTEDEAKQILIELYQGKDFVETAKAKSKAKSAWQKGDLGFLSTFEFPKMESVVKTLEVGDISGVFKGPEGYYIVKLEEKKGGEERAFSELKQEIKDGLTLLKQQQSIVRFLDELSQQTTIEVNENLLEE